MYTQTKVLNMSNKYFDILIKQDQFYWLETEVKNKKPLELLELIEKIIKENIPWANPPVILKENRNHQLEILKQKAISIQSNYLKKVKTMGYYKYAFSGEQITKTQVEDTYQRIQNLLLQQVFSAIPTEIFQCHIGQDLSLRDLFNFAQVNKDCYHLSQQMVRKRAEKKFGFLKASYCTHTEYLISLKRGLRLLIEKHPEVDIEPLLDTVPVWGGLCKPIIYFESSFKMLSQLIANNKDKTTIFNLTESFVKSAEDEEIAVIRLLLACGIPPDAKNSQSKTALLSATPNIHLIRALLDNGANSNQVNQEETPLWRYLPDAEITELLCNKKANIKHLKEGKTPLHKTAEKGWTSSAQILLKNGAEPNSNDQNFNKPIHVATTHTPLILTLLQGGADPNLPDRMGIYPLCHFIHHPQILDVLCQKGANIDLSYALHLAVKEELKDSVKVLLKHRSAINNPDKTGWPPLFYAKTSDMVRLLYMYGANINYQTENQGRTALHMAILKNQEELVLALLECNADISQKDREGKSPGCYCISDSIKEMLLLYQISPEAI